MADEQDEILELDENQIDYAKELQKDADAQRAYVDNIYSKKVKPPKEPNEEDLTFWKLVGIEVTIFFLVAIGTVVFSSIRTGGMFYVMELLLLAEFNIPEIVKTIFSFSSMVGSLMAFEGYLAGKGFFDGKNNEDVVVSKEATIAAFTVIILAGIFSGLGLFGTINEIFKMVFYGILALATAIAGGILSLHSGVNIGYAFKLYEVKKDKILSEYQGKYDEWLNKAYDAYANSNYNIRHKRSDKIFRQKQVFQPTTQEQSEEMDYRTWRRTASEDDLRWLANAQTGEISSKFKLEDRTSLNWIKYAQRDLAKITQNNNP